MQLSSILRLCVLAVVAPCIAGCGDDDGGGSGGQCLDAFNQFQACGGDVQGTWTIQSFCEGKDLTFPDPFAGQCAGYELIASVDSYTGRVSFTDTQTTSEDVVVVGSMSFSFPTSCISQSQTCASLSQNTASRNIPCTEDNGSCRCTGTITTNLSGSAESYSVMNNAIVLTGETPRPYCVRDDTLQVKLEGTEPSGLITFRKQ
jgi:hypothetical protein